MYSICNICMYFFIKVLRACIQYSIYVYTYSHMYITYLSTGPQCPPGRFYVECGPIIPPTCDDFKGVPGCVSGCACPAGQVINSEGTCITPDMCTGRYTLCMYMYIRI